MKATYKKASVLEEKLKEINRTASTKNTIDQITQQQYVSLLKILEETQRYIISI